MAVVITATVQAGVYPPRVAVAVTGLTLGDSITIYRVVAGMRSEIRDGTKDSVVDTSFARIDAEFPFGVPVTYVAEVEGVDAASTTPDTYTLPGGKVVLSDAITGLGAEVVIMAWDAIDRSRQSSAFQVGGRNVVVMGQLGQSEGDVEFFLDTDAGNEDLQTLLENATQGVFQARQPGGYLDVDGYYAATAVRQERFSQDGTDPRRSWTLHLVETQKWSSFWLTATFTYQDVIDFYGVSGTYQDLLDDHASYLDVLIGDWS